MVEANDIFPTVADLAGLPTPSLCATPSSQEMYCVEGVTLRPLWDQPTRPWKRAAFSQFPRPNRGFPQPETGLPPFGTANSSHAKEVVGTCLSFVLLLCAVPAFTSSSDSSWRSPLLLLPRLLLLLWLPVLQVMGYTVRTNTHRFTQWVAFDPIAAKVDWSRSYGQELYSHEAQPVVGGDFDYENENIAGVAANAGLVANLTRILRAGWRASLPPTM